jgi:hypothetical protein
MSTTKTPKRPKKAVQPVTVTFTGKLAEAIRSSARDTRRSPKLIAESWCETGCDRPDGDSGRMFIDVQIFLRGSLQRLADAAGYKDGLVDLALETWIDPETVLDSVARSLIRCIELDAQQIGRIAAVLMEEKIRHSKDSAEKWISEHVFRQEGAEP